MADYGLRCDSAAHFWGDTSTGLQLASALIRAAEALVRLCCVLASTTLSLVSQGTAVVQPGKRRLVDPHGLRGQSYVKIGWHWVQWARVRGYELMTGVHWSSAGAPEPALASKRQYPRYGQSRFAIESPEAA